MFLSEIAHQIAHFMQSGNRTPCLFSSSLQFEYYILSFISISPAVNDDECVTVGIKCVLCNTDVLTELDMDSLRNHGPAIIAHHLFPIYGKTSIASDLEMTHAVAHVSTKYSGLVIPHCVGI